MSKHCRPRSSADMRRRERVLTHIMQNVGFDKFETQEDASGRVRRFGEHGGGFLARWRLRLALRDIGLSGLLIRLDWRGCLALCLGDGDQALEDVLADAGEQRAVVLAEASGGDGGDEIGVVTLREEQD